MSLDDEFKGSQQSELSGVNPLGKSKRVAFKSSSSEKEEEEPDRETLQKDNVNITSPSTSRGTDSGNKSEKNAEIVSPTPKSDTDDEEKKFLSKEHQTRSGRNVKPPKNYSPSDMELAGLKKKSEPKAEKPIKKEKY